MGEIEFIDFSSLYHGSEDELLGDEGEARLVRFVPRIKALSFHSCSSLLLCLLP